MKNISKEKHGGLSNKMDVVDDKEGRVKGNSVLRRGTRKMFLFSSVAIAVQLTQTWLLEFSGSHAIL